MSETAVNALQGQMFDEFVSEYYSKSQELNLSENAKVVLEKRYQTKNEDGKAVETPAQLFRRVAKNIAQAEEKHGNKENMKDIETLFNNLLTSLNFTPNSPTLMNAGRKLQQLSACFVLPVDDSMESIFEAVKNTAIVHKSGGGTGFSFSRLRPRNDYVSSTYGLSSGPVSFMKAFDAATHAVNQGGFRRGANMGIMRVDHPDILDFISCKEDQHTLNNFNISVGLTEGFMSAVLNNQEYELINPRNKKPIHRLNAGDVFNKIVQMAWKNGEPGIIFLDRINADNPTPSIGEIESTNPCGEQPLLPYEACNLGSINLSGMVDAGKINYKKLKETVWLSVRFLDNVIDMSKFPLEQITQMVRSNRKIGLGVMGFADMLIKLNIPYNSEAATIVADEVMSFINSESKKASAYLASVRGTFPNWSVSIYNRPGGMKLRNATTTTIAPTGTISIISGCSSGIEPLFAVSFVRNVMDGHKLYETNELFKQIAMERGFYSEKLIEQIAKTGSVQHINEVPDDVKRVFVTAHDITPEWHIKMQAAFQKHTDNAVSKTVNFKHSAAEEDVRKVYTLAYELGCKGVTIYRDGSRDNQVLSTSSTDTAQHSKQTTVPAPVQAASNIAQPEAEKQKAIPAQQLDALAASQLAAASIVKRKRPRILTGQTVQMTTGCGPIYITVNEDEHGVFELFNTMGKAGGCAASQSEAIGRLVSLAWRSGLQPDVIIKQLMGIRCHKQSGLGDNKILSCADAIAKAIQVYMRAKQHKEIVIEDDALGVRGACPQCGGVLEHEGGCFICHSCAFSECS